MSGRALTHLLSTYSVPVNVPDTQEALKHAHVLSYTPAAP